MPPIQSTNDEYTDVVLHHDGTTSLEFEHILDPPVEHVTAMQLIAYDLPSRKQTVDSSNADSIVGQWQKIHKVEGPPTRVEKVDGFPRQVWCDQTGRVVIEQYIIGEMGHGTPISAEGDEGLGEEGKYMLEVGISSTRQIADFWGLTQ